MSSTLSSLLRNSRLYAIGLLITCLIVYRVGAQPSSHPVRPRIVVTADPELDDNNSLIRFLLYSSDLDIEGLIYASK